MFLSKDSLTAEIITAKSSEMNICIPKGDAGDFVSESSLSVVVSSSVELFLFVLSFSRSTLYPSSLRPSGMVSSLSQNAVIFDL